MPRSAFASINGNRRCGRLPAPAKVGVNYISSHDGTPNTLLVSESLIMSGAKNPTGTRQKPSLYLTEGSDIYWYRPQPIWNVVDPLTVPDELNLGFEWSSLAVARSDGSAPKTSDQIASRHPGVAICSFCDGHQASLSEDLDTNVFKHLMTPYGRGYTGGDKPTGVFDEGAL